MQISYRRFVKFNSLVTIVATNSNIKIIQDSILERIEFECEYNELSGQTARGHVGASEWASLGWILLAMPFFIYIFIMSVFFPDYRREPLALITYSIFVIGSLFAFSMRFLKEDWVWFYYKTNSTAFGIKINRDEKDRTEALIKYIKQRIKESSKEKKSKKKLQ